MSPVLQFECFVFVMEHDRSNGCYRYHSINLLLSLDLVERTFLYFTCTCKVDLPALRHSFGMNEICLYYLLVHRKQIKGYHVFKVYRLSFIILHMNPFKRMFCVCNPHSVIKFMIKWKVSAFTGLLVMKLEYKQTLLLQY